MRKNNSGLNRCWGRHVKGWLKRMTSKKRRRVGGKDVQERATEMVSDESTNPTENTEAEVTTEASEDQPKVIRKVDPITRRLSRTKVRGKTSGFYGNDGNLIQD